MRGGCDPAARTLLMSVRSTGAAVGSAVRVREVTSDPEVAAG